jgi:hypothetical protein
MADGERHYIEQVVVMSDLHNQTSAGWEVVEKIEFDDQISYQEQQIQPGSSYPVPVTRIQIGRNVAFRCRRAVDSPVATLTEQVSKLQSQQWASENEKKRAEEALEAEKKAHQNTKCDLTRAREYTELQRKDKDKIREYLGRKVFEEILPPQPKQEGKG